MMRREFEDYAELGAQYSLEPPEVLPDTIATPANWYCIDCGQTCRISFGSLKRCGKSKCPHKEKKRSRTAEDYAELGAQYKLEPPEVLPDTIATPADWYCIDCEQSCHISFKNLKQDGKTNCPHPRRLSRSQKLGIEEYLQQAEEHRLEPPEVLPDTTATPADWYCIDCGQTCRISFGNLKRRGKTKCPHKAQKRSCTAEDYTGLEAQYRLEPPEVLPVNTSTPADWYCIDCKQICRISFQDLKRNGKTKCPHEASNRRNVAEDDYTELGAQYRLEPPKVLPVNTFTPADWYCIDCKQICRIRFQDLKRRGKTKCPHEAKRRSREDYAELGAQYRLKPPKVLPVNILTRAVWLCLDCDYTCRISFQKLKRHGKGKCPHKIKL